MRQKNMMLRCLEGTPLSACGGFKGGLKMFKPNTLEEMIRFDIICSSGLRVFHNNVVEKIAQFAQVAG